jgi:hypothetical protein
VQGFRAARERTKSSPSGTVRMNVINPAAKLALLFNSDFAVFGTGHSNLIKGSQPHRAVYLSRVSHNHGKAVSSELNKNVAITLDKGDYITL